jgi:hypothetical protein
MPYIRLGKALRFAALPLLALTLSAGAFAVTPQHTDGEAPTQVGPGSGAYKQHTDGEAPTQVGPGSGAYNAGQR